MASPSVSTELKRQLQTIAEGFSGGVGPVEADVIDCVRAGNTARLQTLRARVDAIYPADVRRWLDQSHLGRLYRDDLSKAYARLAAFTPPAAPPARVRPVSIGAGRAGLERGRTTLVILVAAVSLWPANLASPVATASPELPLPVNRSPPSDDATAAPIATASDVCRFELEEQAVAWCVRALGGLPEAPGNAEQRATAADAAPLSCEDAPSLNNETVRVALDRLFEDGVASTYSSAEVGDRCTAAADVARPGTGSRP